jgi:hypothetical protein
MRIACSGVPGVDDGVFAAAGCVFTAPLAGDVVTGVTVSCVAVVEPGVPHAVNNNAIATLNTIGSSAIRTDLPPCIFILFLLSFRDHHDFIRDIT